MNKEWYGQLPIDNINDVKAVSGGDVNDAYEIQTTDQKYFLLVQPNASKDFFLTEKAGLQDLEDAGITVPTVYDVGEINGGAYLLISFLKEGARGSDRDLAEMIAKMHRASSDNSQFGYDLPHQGSDITFDNTWTDSWIELFVERRMDKLRDAIIENKQWSQNQADTYKNVREVMIEKLSNHQSKPSLLHGDLWGGNHMFLTNGEPALFDPSPFYGDREFDLGLTTGFGGYSQEFYSAYQELFPMEDGYEERLAFYRLYLFMIHLLKFGGIYEQRVDQTMQEILQ